MPYAKIKEPPKYPPCQFNDGVECSHLNRKCVTCGWNPRVAWERLRKYDVYPSVGAIPSGPYLPGAVVFIYQDNQLHPYTLEEDAWHPAQFA